MDLEYISGMYYNLNIFILNNNLVPNVTNNYLLITKLGLKLILYICKLENIN